MTRDDSSNLNTLIVSLRKGERHVSIRPKRAAVGVLTQTWLISWQKALPGVSKVICGGTWLCSADVANRNR